MGATLAVTAIAILGPLAGVASAAANLTSPTGTMDCSPSPTPAGCLTYTNGQSITVSGTGFSTLASGNTIEILECSDPNGDPNNQATDNSTCDGTTLNPSTIYPTTCPAPSTATNCFSATYHIKQLNTPANQINCNATNWCDLWVGEDYVNNFSGTSAQPVTFSAPFLVTSPVGAAPEAPMTIALPLAGAAVVGGGTFLVFRRRRAAADSVSAS
ncbi:MAG TPA: hypothetical protein VEI83_05005 [Acidimicrobiales bacterium]|nr:hypothetical protein [Acidimicrobiales bacterium]